MQQKNNDQNSVISQIDGILSKMSNQVSFLIRNNKLMNQLDVDLLMENTRKLYDTLCSVKCNIDVNSIPMEVEKVIEGEEEFRNSGIQVIEDEEEQEGLVEEEDFEEEEFEGSVLEEEDDIEDEELESSEIEEEYEEFERDFEEDIEDAIEEEEELGNSGIQVIEDEEEQEGDEEFEEEDMFEDDKDEEEGTEEFEEDEEDEELESSEIEEEYEEFERDFEDDIEEAIGEEEEFRSSGIQGLEDEEEQVGDEEFEEEEFEDDEDDEEEKDLEEEDVSEKELEGSVPKGQEDSGIRAYKKVYTVEPQTLGDKLEAAVDTSLAARLQRKPVTDLASAIGINDKFLLLNELFGGSMEKYNKSIRALNNFSTLLGAKTYMSELQIEFQWNIESDAYKKLDNLVERRFM